MIENFIKVSWKSGENGKRTVGFRTEANTKNLQEAVTATGLMVCSIAKAMAQVAGPEKAKRDILSEIMLALSADDKELEAQGVTIVTERKREE